MATLLRPRWNTAVDWAQSCEDTRQNMQGLGLRVVMQPLQDIRWLLDNIVEHDSGKVDSEATAEGGGRGKRSCRVWTRLL